MDFRLVCATNKDLAKMVAEGTFREDLYYRLNVIDIRMPALKDHREDIAPLVDRFIGDFSQRNGGSVTGIAPDALKVLEEYQWPGNVRQLRNAIEKMCVLASGETLTVDDVPREIANPPPAQGAPREGETLADTEKDTILRILDECGGNKSRAAEKLGISRRTLHRKLKEWRSE